MHAPALITRRCIPKDDDSYHLPTIFGEKHELALLGFKNADLNKHKSCDFPEELIHNWLTHMSLLTKGKNMDNMPLILATPIDQHDTIVEPTAGETWALEFYPTLIPFWGTSQKSHGQKYDSEKLQHHLKE